MAMVPVVLGPPSSEAFTSAHDGQLTLGGCVVTGDEPSLACKHCGAEMWPGGVFRSAGEESLAVGIGGRPGKTAYTAFFHLRDLNLIAPGRQQTFAQTLVPAAEVPTVLMVLCVELFTTGKRLTGWLRYRHLPWFGELNGPIDRFAVANDMSLIAIDSDGDLFVPGDHFERLVLNAVRSQGFKTVDEFEGWLQAYGLEFR
jgi:hypothetical protein